MWQSLLLWWAESSRAPSPSATHSTRLTTSSTKQIWALGLGIAVILANVRYQWDRHIWDVQFTVVQDANIVAMAAKLLFTLAATFTRVSLICFYYRLIKDSGSFWFRWMLHSSMLWTIAVCISFVVLTVFQCTPVESYWLFPPMNKYHCLDEGKVTLAAGIINCVSDLLVTLIPIPIVMRLHMPLSQRFGVVVLLTLGIVVTVAGVVRTYFIWLSLIASWDETWYSYPLWISAVVEIDLAVVSRNTLRCIFRWLEPPPPLTSSHEAVRMRSGPETSFVTSMGVTHLGHRLNPLPKFYARPVER